MCHVQREKVCGQMYKIRNSEHLGDFGYFNGLSIMDKDLKLTTIKLSLIKPNQVKISGHLSSNKENQTVLESTLS